MIKHWVLYSPILGKPADNSISRTAGFGSMHLHLPAGLFKVFFLECVARVPVSLCNSGG